MTDLEQLAALHSARLKWMAEHQVAIEELVIAACGGDRPLWYIAERFARRRRHPAGCSSHRRVYGESEISIEAAIDAGMARTAAGKEPYYA